MTVLERRVANGKTYEVRRVGQATALYTDGVLHTRYDAKHPFTGRIWDLLALPGIVTRARRVLVLGVAGGTAIRHLLAYGAPTHIDAVDLDATHLALGRAHFGLDDPRIHMHHEDARDFVMRRGPPYDLVIDDVFKETRRAPERAIRYDTAWGDAVYARLSSRGALVVNSAGVAEVRATVLREPAFLARFETVLTLETETAGNVVHALFRGTNDATLAAGAFRRHSTSALGLSTSRLEMKVRTVRRGDHAR